MSTSAGHCSRPAPRPVALGPHPDRPQRAVFSAAARRPAVPLPGAGAAVRRVGADRAGGQRDHRLRRRQTRPAAQPVQPARRAARPGRRSAVHPGRAGRLRHPRVHPVVGGRVDHRPGRAAGRDPAGAAAVRLHRAARALPRQGRHLLPVLRAADAAAGAAGRLDRRGRPADQLRVHRLGTGHVPVGRGDLLPPARLDHQELPARAAVPASGWPVATRRATRAHG